MLRDAFDRESVFPRHLSKQWVEIDGCAIKFFEEQVQFLGPHNNRYRLDQSAPQRRIEVKQVWLSDWIDADDPFVLHRLEQPTHRRSLLYALMREADEFGVSKFRSMFLPAYREIMDDSSSEAEERVSKLASLNVDLRRQALDRKFGLFLSRNWTETTKFYSDRNETFWHPMNEIVWLPVWQEGLEQAEAALIAHRVSACR